MFLLDNYRVFAFIFILFSVLFHCCKLCDYLLSCLYPYYEQETNAQPRHKFTQISVFYMIP